MRNDTVDEREELPGCVQAGKVWKCVFPRSCAVCFEKICPSLQPGCKAGLWGEGIQLPSSQDCCCSAGCQWESLSKPTHPNWGHVWLLGRRWRAQEQSDSARPWVTPRAHFSELLILMYCFTRHFWKQQAASWAPPEPMQNSGKASISYTFAASLDCGKALGLPCEQQGRNRWEGRPPAADLCPSNCRGMGRAPAVPLPGWGGAGLAGCQVSDSQVGVQPTWLDYLWKYSGTELISGVQWFERKFLGCKCCTLMCFQSWGTAWADPGVSPVDPVPPAHLKVSRSYYEENRGWFCFMYKC